VWRRSCRGCDSGTNSTPSRKSDRLALVRSPLRVHLLVSFAQLASFLIEVLLPNMRAVTSRLWGVLQVGRVHSSWRSLICLRGRRSLPGIEDRAFISTRGATRRLAA